MALVGDGRHVVTTAGTEVKLSAGTASTTTGPIKWVTVTALEGNTGVIVVGGPDVVAAAGTRRGTPLWAKDSFTVETDDLADVYIDSTVNGEGVSFTFGF